MAPAHPAVANSKPAARTMALRIIDGSPISLDKRPPRYE
jgi:hypothetical protein